MIKSGTTYLYCGVDIIKKGHSNVPYIMEICDRLINMGLTIRYLMGDRWFATMELLQELPSRGIDYIGPYKKYKPIKKMITDYLQNRGDYVKPYTIRGSPSKHYKKVQNVWMILTNRRGRRLREIRAEYLKGKASLQESIEQIMVMMTMCPPPKVKKRRQGWSHHICALYDHRWQIETGFKDLNRITPSSNARSEARKFIMTTVRYWVYNIWQIERARRKKLRGIKKSWRRGPTLRRFSFCIYRQEYYG
ncbi:MAG: transposase [Promethearchaeota archaeon]